MTDIVTFFRVRMSRKNIVPSKFKLLIVVLSLSSCRSNKLANVIEPGNYTTANIKAYEALKLNAFNKKDFSLQIEMVLALKKDSTFQVGYCHREIVLEGKWAAKSDTLRLFDIYNYQQL